MQVREKMWVRISNQKQQQRSAKWVNIIGSWGGYAHNVVLPQL